MSSLVQLADKSPTWRLLFTKPRAETWVEANLRKQGFAVLHPLTRTRSGLSPLFPRYVFAGVHPGQQIMSLAGTFGVAYVVQCGVKPARVPLDVIVAIRERMNLNGVVDQAHLDDGDPIFTRRAASRAATLAKFATAGFRVRSA